MEIVPGGRGQGLPDAVPVLVVAGLRDGLVVRGRDPEALVSVLRPLSSAAYPPRQLIRKLNIGATVGRPNDTETQLDTLRRMIALIENAPAFGSVDADG